MEYSFEENLIVGGIAADRPFWRALEEGSLKLPQCTKCQTWTWPAHYRCGACGSWKFDWLDVEPTGQVFSWTRTHYAFERVKERADQVPYVTVLTELPQAGGARVLGLLDGDEAGLKVGASVDGHILPPSHRSKGYPSIVWRLQ